MINEAINILINAEKVSLLGELDVGKLPSGWMLLVWGIVGFLTFFGGVVSGNAMIILGAAMMFAVTSAYLTSQVKSEHIVKKAWEVVSAIMAMGIVTYGYVITGSIVLGVMTLFIAIMFFIAFVLSYLLPKIRNKSMTSSQNRLKEK